MKKFLRIVALMLIMAMLLPMTPVELFAAEIDGGVTQTEENGEGTQTGSEAIDQPQITPKTDYTNPEFYTDASGNKFNSTQSVHFATVVEGDLNWSIVDDPDTADVNEKKVYAKGVAALVPDIEPIKVSNKYITKTFAEGAQTTTNGDDYYNLTPSDSQELDYRIPDCEYYVVEDDNSIYITVRLAETKTQEGAFITTGEYSVWVGLNPADYSQAINFNIDQHVANFTAGFNDSSLSDLKKASGNDWLVTSIFGRYAYDIYGAEKGWDGLNSYTNYRGAETVYVKYFNFEIDKEKIAYYWDALYGTDFYTAEGDYELPNAMFLGVSSKAANSSDGIDPFCFAHGITSVPKSIVGSWGTKSVLLPDVIIRGTERNIGACADGCTFTKNVNDAFKFTNEDGTTYYYTSCAVCNTVGYQTFAKCEVTDTHSYVDKPAKAATCIAPAISAYQYCTECGYTTGGEISGSPLRWTNGVPGLDATGMASYGQDIHVAGAATVVSGDLNWTIVDDPETTNINEKSSNAKGAVSLVPGIKPIKITNKYEASHYTGNYQSIKNNNTYYNNAPATSQNNIGKVPDGEYYIVEDDNSIYVTVRLVEKSWGENDDCIKDNRYWVAIGLNPNDYSQTVTLYLGANKENLTVSGFNDSKTPSLKQASSNDWLVNTLSARYKIGANSTDGGLNSYKNYNSSNTGVYVPWVKYLNIEIDKAKIAYYWDEIYGTDFYVDNNGTDSDWTDDNYNLSNAVFVALSGQAEACTDDTAKFYYTLGATSLAKYHANTLGTYSVYLPDVVILGDEKKIPGCSYTAHNIDGKYRVPGTLNSYYHSCIDCGAFADTAFTIDANGSHYTVSDATITGAVKTAPTCVAEGVGIKSCSCGKLDPTETKTFTIPMLPHDFVEAMDNKYLIKAATCVAGAQYYESCSSCGLQGETIFTTSPLRWPTGSRPDSAIDYSALYTLGQNAYLVGGAAKVSDDLLPTDLEMGVNYKKGLTFKDYDKGLVDVTGEGNKVKSILTTGGVASSMMKTAPNSLAREDSDFVELGEADYYVAYNRDYVFLTIREQGGTYNAFNGTVMNTQRIGSINIRIGFNPANPNQYINLTNNVSINFTFDGFYNGSTKVTSGYGTILERGLSRKFPLATENSHTGANGNNVGYSSSGKYVTYHTVVLNKTELANAYNTALGAQTYTKETLPNTMFVSLFGSITSQAGVGMNAYYTTGNPPVPTTDPPTTRDESGASVTAYQMAYGLTELETAYNGVYTIPDLIILGDEKEVGCDFTKHTLDYLVPNSDKPNEDGTGGTEDFYHSCSLCGSVGVKKFTVNYTVDPETSNKVYDIKSSYTNDDSTLEGAVAKVPTCEGKGTGIYSCSVCKALEPTGEKIFTIPASGHDEETNHLIIGEGDYEGYHWYVCKNCDKGTQTLPDGFVLTEENNAHKYVIDNLFPDDNGDGIADNLKVKGDCETLSVYYKLCECGLIATSDEYTFEDGEIGHTWINGEITESNRKSEATCTSAAIYYQKCEECSKTSFEVEGKETTHIFTHGELLAHTWVDVPAKAPTCVAIGYNEHEQCSKCGKTEGYVSYDPLRWPVGTAPEDRTDYTNLQAYGQQVYVAGSAAKLGKDETITIDAKKDDRYVRVSPTAAEGGVSKVLGAGLYSSVSSSAALATEGNAEYLSDIEYYVAYSDDKIYFLVRDIGAEYVDDNGTPDDTTDDVVYRSRRHNYNWRIGFNPNDYSQALLLSTAYRYGETNAEHVAVEINGLVDATTNYKTSEFYTANAANVVGTTKMLCYTYNASTDAPTGTATGGNQNWDSAQYCKFLEFELDKQAIINIFNGLNGTNYTKATFPNTMFVAMSSSFYWGTVSTNGKINTITTDDIPDSITGTLTPTYGAIIPSDQAIPNGATTRLIPHVIILGDEKENIGCSFTAHRTDGKYLKEKTEPDADGKGTATFYHSCTECESKGARTFTVNYTSVLEGENRVYSYDLESSYSDIGSIEALVPGQGEVSCNSMVNYYKSCAGCGAIAQEYTFSQQLVHNWESKIFVGKNDTPITQATCNADATYYKYCQNCDSISDEIWVDEGSMEAHRTEFFKKTDGYKAPTCIGIGYDEYWSCSAEWCKHVEIVGEKAPLRYVKGTTQENVVDHSGLILLGQDLYTAGVPISDEEFNWSSIGEKGIDGMTKIVPSNKVIASRTVAGAARWNEDPSDYYNLTEGSQANIDKAADVEYYVAQTESKIYVTFRVLGKSWLAADGTTKVYMNRCNYSFRLGFNPDNYAQSMILNYSMNSFVPSASISDKNTDEENAQIVRTTKVTFTSDYSKNALGTAGDDVITNSQYRRYSYDGTTEGTSYSDFNGTAGSQFVLYASVEIDKEKLAEVWDTVFAKNTGYTTDYYKEDGTFELPNTMFIASSFTQFNSDSSSITPLYSANILTKEEMDGTKILCPLLPDVIVFGEEKNEMAAPGCSFTGHSTDDKYKVDENTYYHSCIYCHVAGARTFDVDENNIPLYNADSVDAKYLVEGSSAATCTSEGTYYKSCSCGLMAKDDEEYKAIAGNEVTVDIALGHDFTQRIEDEAHLKETVNCQSHNTYWYDCSRCDVISTEDFFVGETVGHHAVDTDNWVSANNKHFHVCTVDGCDYKEDEASCSGGNATCTVLAVCSTCHRSYGSFSDHNYGEDKICTVCGKLDVAWDGEDELPDDVNKYYATNKTPTVDGVINVGEYGEVIRVETPRLMLNYRQDAWADTEADPNRSIIEALLPEYMEYYFAYDNDYIYIAIRDVSKDKVDDIGVSLRNNYHFTLGFDPENPQSYFSFGGYRTDGNSAGWNALYYNEKVIDIKTYNLIDEGIFRKYEKGNTDSSSYLAYGDFGSVNGNLDQANVAWTADIEFRISKDTLKQILKEQTGKDYSELSNSMWFSATTQGYNSNVEKEEGNSQYVRWIGQGESLYDIVVFDEQKPVITRLVVNTCEECGEELSYVKAKAPTYEETGYEGYTTCTCGYNTKVDLPVATPTFKTGYDRIPITPTDLSKIEDYDSVLNDIYATCVAVDDGEKTVIMVSIDTGSLAEEYCQTLRNRINKVTGVPYENIIIAVTHDHNSPNLKEDSKWRFVTYHAIAESAQSAINDLKESTIKVGTTKTTGLAWVRNYVNENGQFTHSNGPGNGRGTVASAWDADDVLQAVRFVRDDAKDILIINWQAHLANGTVYERMIHADMAGIIRDDIEEADKDVNVAYFAGASGNVNLNAPTDAHKAETAEKYGFKPDKQKNPDNEEALYLFENVAHSIANLTLAINNFRTIDSGRIKIEYQYYVLDVTEDISEAAYNYAATVKANPAYKGMAFPTYAAGYLQKRYENSPKAEGKRTRTLHISAFSFGELAIVNAPYEIFDNSGQQIKDASHFEMTLVFSNSGGAMAYMPSKEAFDLESLHQTDDGKPILVKDIKFPEKEADEIANPDWYIDRPYETMATYFIYGSAEIMVGQFQSMLNTMKGHDWTVWTIVIEPTVTDAGKATRTCSKCGIETIVLPALTEENVAETATAGKYTIADDGVTYVYMHTDESTIFVISEYVSINISWGTMAFIYTNCKWNPDDLKYNIGEWQPATADANLITIENAGTVDVNVTFIYVSEAAYEYLIGGVFTGVDANGKVKVVANETKDVTLELIERARPEEFESVKVGTITITITEADAE